MSNVDKFLESVEQLRAIVLDPHPGLVGWTQAYFEALEGVAEWSDYHMKHLMLTDLEAAIKEKKTMPNENKTTLSAVPGNADEWLVVDAEGFVVAIVRDRKLEGLRAEEFARLFAAVPTLRDACNVAEKLLDSVAFVSIEGDTQLPLFQIRKALAFTQGDQ